MGVLAVVALVWVVWASRQPAPVPPASDPRVGTAASTFRLPRLADGEVRALEDYRNDAVLIDFWATTCPPCRRSIPLIERLVAEHGDAGLSVISLNVDMPDPSRNAVVEVFARDQRMTTDILIDNGRVAYDYDAARIPLVFVLDRDLTVRHVLRGFKEYDVLDAAVRDTIAASRGGLAGGGASL